MKKVLKAVTSFFGMIWFLLEYIFQSITILLSEVNDIDLQGQR